MKQLTDKLIVIIVPEVKDNRYFKLWDDTNSEWIIECQIDKINNEYIRNLGNIDGYNIIGTITKSGEFDFDCEKYVGLCKGYGYRNYQKDDYNGGSSPFDVWAAYHLKTKEQSFISLLNSKGIFLEKLNNQKILILEKITEYNFIKQI
jgi:hypothetical protein